MRRPVAHLLPAEGMRAAVCAVLAMLALSGAFAPARAAEQSCPPSFFNDRFNGCEKPSERNTLPLDDREPMRFEVQELDRSHVFLQGTGTITPETPAALRAFLATPDGQMSRDLSLHSPGGDLAAALDLGEVIRQARLNTDISRTILLAVWDRRYEEADCIGACAFAFLGGVTRYAGGGARYGLSYLGGGEARAGPSAQDGGAVTGERPAAGAEQPAASSANGAVTREKLAAYLDRMGVARELLDTAPSVPGEIAALPHERRMALRVILEPSGRTVFEPRSGSPPSVAFEILTHDHDLTGQIVCRDGAPQLTISDRSRRLFSGLEGMVNRPATFKDPQGRFLQATVSHVPADASGRDPALVFRIPGLTAAAFEEAGLTFHDLQRLPRRRKDPEFDIEFLDHVEWQALVYDKPFTVAADNAKETLPQVLRGCGGKPPRRAQTTRRSQP